MMEILLILAGIGFVVIVLIIATRDKKQEKQIVHMKNRFFIPTNFSSIMESNLLYNKELNQKIKAIYPIIEYDLEILSINEANQYFDKYSRAIESVLNIKNSLLLQEEILLPNLDSAYALFFAVNANIGDDVALALDYRDSIELPRVVYGDFVRTEEGLFTYQWVVLEENCNDFLLKLAL